MLPGNRSGTAPGLRYASPWGGGAAPPGRLRPFQPAQTLQPHCRRKSKFLSLDVLRVAALDPYDTRHLDVRVAGAAALLVAKVHKIDDRTDTDRLSDKDALDVLRLLRGTPTAELVHRYRNLLGDDRSAAVATRGRALLEAQFAQKRGLGTEMAVRSAGPLADADEIAASCEVLARDLLASLQA